MQIFGIDVRHAYVWNPIDLLDCQGYCYWKCCWLTTIRRNTRSWWDFLEMKCLTPKLHCRVRQPSWQLVDNDDLIQVLFGLVDCPRPTIASGTRWAEEAAQSSCLWIALSYGKKRWDKTCCPSVQGGKRLPCWFRVEWNCIGLNGAPKFSWSSLHFQSLIGGLTLGGNSPSDRHCIWGDRQTRRCPATLGSLAWGFREDVIYIYIYVYIYICTHCISICRIYM